MQATVTLIRERFLILGTHNAVMRQINKCHNCYKFKQATTEQIMGALPKERQMALKLFTNVGLDYDGPLEIRASSLLTNKITKGYICLFVCFSLKAIHLEAVIVISQHRRS